MQKTKKQNKTDGNLSNVMLQRCLKHIFLSVEEKDFWKNKIPELNDAELKKLELIFDDFDGKFKEDIQKICEQADPKEMIAALKTFKQNALTDVSTKMRKHEIDNAETVIEDALKDIDN